MQGWSWMAALTLVATSIGAFAPSVTAAEPTPVKQKVKLVLRLDGHVAGTEITVKPGNPGCRFKTMTRVMADKNFVETVDVETVNADRDCSFSITIKEPGQAERIIRRSIQIEAGADGKPAAAQTFSCLLTSKSVIGSRPVATGKTDEPTRKK